VIEEEPWDRRGAFSRLLGQQFDSLCNGAPHFDNGQIWRSLTSSPRQHFHLKTA
jgi:hypothetical protein